MMLPATTVPSTAIVTLLRSTFSRRPTQTNPLPVLSMRSSAAVNVVSGNRLTSRGGAAPARLRAAESCATSTRTVLALTWPRWTAAGPASVGGTSENRPCAGGWA